MPNECSEELSKGWEAQHAESVQRRLDERSIDFGVAIGRWQNFGGFPGERKR